MARPSKERRVCRMPVNRVFFSEQKKETGNRIILSVEEYEVLRLMDYCGYTQAECAKQMDVGRGTVQSIYCEARKKLARFLVEGIPIQIDGGNYKVCMEETCESKDCKVPAIQRESGELNTRIAVSYDQGKIYQHFGHTREFKIYDVENGAIVNSYIIDTNGQGHGALAGFLQAEQVKILICGGIGGGARNALSQASIALYPGASGDADEQVLSFIQGKLVYDPNTICQHHKHRNGKSCGKAGEL